MVVQINFIYERQALLNLYGLLHGTEYITGSNAQTSECTLFWQHERQQQCIQSMQQISYNAESDNNHQALWQTKFLQAITCETTTSTNRATASNNNV